MDSVVRLMILVAVVVALSDASLSVGGADPRVAILPADSATCQQLIDAHYPQQYVAFKAQVPPVIDGNIDEPVWNEVPFSDDFVDISTTTKPQFRTRMKIRYDDSWLYVAGHIEDPHVWAKILHTCHCIDPNEDQVIFHDNDFEVFVDADATTHYYKEFEINAAAATWDLLLNRPYENGGYENSTRVFGDKGFDMVPPLVAATKVLDGVLNVPDSNPTGWTVEIAFPLFKLAYNTTASIPPKSRDMWRINFSRVEWRTKVVNNTYVKDPSCQSCPNPGAPTCDNWAWSPMYAIAMHRPELWGILQFSDALPNATAPLYYDTWPLRYVAHELFYANYAYGSRHDGVFSGSIGELAKYANYPQVIDGTCTSLPTIILSSDRSHYVAVIKPKPSSSGRSGADEKFITITDTRLITEHNMSELDAHLENLRRDFA